MVKTTIILIISILLLIGCSKENVAKKLVEENMKVTLNDYSNYEPLEFSELTQAYSSVEELKEYQDFSKNADNAKIELGKLIEDFLQKRKYLTGNPMYDMPIRTALVKQYKNICDNQDFIAETSRLIDSLKHEYKPIFIGMKITHKYRTKTLDGKMRLNSKVFIFDKKVTHIISSSSL